MKKIFLKWKVGYSNSESEKPKKYVPAVVPGAVQLDWAKAENLPPYWYADNCKKYEWMEDVFWLYKAEIPDIKLDPSEELILYIGGVDYSFSVSVNDEILLKQEGMFTPVTLNLSRFVKERGIIEVKILPPPKNPKSLDPEISSIWEPRWQANSTCKPPVSYGWDFHPRLIPSGIWDETYLCLCKLFRITDLYFTYELNDDLSVVTGNITVETTVENNLFLNLSIEDPTGKIVWKEKSLKAKKVSSIEFQIKDPLLWWCKDQGKQNLYLIKAELVDLQDKVIDTRVKRCGFRRIRLVMHEGQWERNSSLANTQALPPVTFEINGRKIFCRGSNWVAPDIFPGTITEQTYRPLLELAVNANFNLLRCWGGAIVNKESFFDICDEKGIMIWQEFPLACMSYEPTKSYLKVLEQEARSIIKRLRLHPCISLWCGGNELFCSWSRTTMQNIAIRLLDKLCLEMSPLIPFIPTSPIMGMRHGWYMFRTPDYKQDIFEFSIASDATAYPEFGCSGPSPVEYIKKFIPEEELFPPKKGTSWEIHHGVGAFGKDGNGWLCLDQIEYYFGRPENLEELVEKGTWLQCEGLKAAFEEYRRQKPRSAIALNWDFNEPWPSAAGNNLVNWPCRPKPCFEDVKNACRPQMLSIRIPRFDWNKNDSLSLEVWMLNDLYEEIPSKEAIIKVDDSVKNILTCKVIIPSVPLNKHVCAGKIQVDLIQAQSGPLFIKAEIPQEPQFNSVYKILLR